MKRNYTRVNLMADNGSQPVTRAELREELAAFEARLTEEMRDMQTETLRAFHGWAGPFEQRMRGTQSFVMGFEERLALLEERVRKIESDRLSK